MIRIDIDAKRPSNLQLNAFPNPVGSPFWAFRLSYPWMAIHLVPAKSYHKNKPRILVW